MTKEQIAAFWSKSSNCDCYAKELVPRLLDEREALLEALRGALDSLDNASEGGRFYADTTAQARAVIAKSEAP